VQLAKRIVPVVIRDTPTAAVPPPLPDINWHFVTRESFDDDVARLVEVLETDIARVHQHTRLLVRATEWDTRGGDASLLLRGAQLTEAEQWLEGQTDRKPTTVPVQSRFIATSRRAASRRQRGSIAAAVAIATTMAIVATLAIFFWHNATVQRNAATLQRTIAVSRQLAAESQTNLTGDPQLALILALRAYDSNPTEGAMSAVREAVRQSTVRAMTPPPDTDTNELTRIGQHAFDASGQHVVTHTELEVQVWDWTRSPAGDPDHVVANTVGQEHGSVVGSEFRATGDVVFATTDGTVFAWDWHQGQAPQAISTIAHVGQDPVLSPGGKYAIEFDYVNPDGLVTLTPLDGGRTMRLAAGKAVRAVALSPDERYLATNGDADVDVWTLADLSRPVTYPVGEGVAGGSMAFSPDDSRLAVAFGESAKVLNLTATTDPAQTVAKARTLSIDPPPGHPAHCCDVDAPLLVWSPDGKQLAAGTADASLRVWEGDSPTPLYLNGNVSTSGGVAFSTDGKYIATGGGQVAIWEWTAGSAREYAGTAKGLPIMRPDGNTVAVATDAIDTVLVDTRGVSTPLGHGIPLAFSADGRHLAMEQANAITVWDLNTRSRIASLPVSNRDDFDTIPGYAMSDFDVAFDLTGGVLAVRDQTERPASLLIWPWASAKPPVTLRPDGRSDAGVTALLGWRPDQRVDFIDDSTNGLQSWDGTGPATVLQSLPEGASSDGLFQVAYLTPSKIVLTASHASIWDLTAQTVTEVLPDYGPSQFALADKGPTLAVSTDDGYVGVWDLQPASAPIEVGRYGVAPHLAVNPDASLLAVNDTTGLHLVPTTFAMPFPAVLSLARSLVVRHLTSAEEAEYSTD
jgi:WD40 repeat protein